MSIIVTGEPRSGTSLMMNVLSFLGCDVMGNKFPKRKDPKKKERVQYLNPDGFWELPIVSRGIKEDIGNKTIKMICRGVLNTPKEVIDTFDKVIFCLRDPREVVKSQRKLISGIMVSKKNDWAFSPEFSKTSYRKYNLNVGMYFLAANRLGLWDRTLIVDYEDMVFDSQNQIMRICNFLELPYNDEAIKLIRRDLYRSTPVEKSDELSIELYGAIKNRKFDAIEESIKNFIEDVRLKNIKWLDDTEFKTWVMGSRKLYKSLESNNKGVLDKLKKTASIKALPTDCCYYDNSGERYLVKRYELPDLIRTKIKCSKDNKEVTREICYKCWQRSLISQVSQNLTYIGIPLQDRQKIITELAYKHRKIR